MANKGPDRPRKALSGPDQPRQVIAWPGATPEAPARTGTRKP
jgi:hypothetical protein